MKRVIRKLQSVRDLALTLFLWLICRLGIVTLISPPTPRKKTPQKTNSMKENG